MHDKTKFGNVNSHESAQPVSIVAGGGKAVIATVTTGSAATSAVHSAASQAVPQSGRPAGRKRSWRARRNFWRRRWRLVKQASLVSLRVQSRMALVGLQRAVTAIAKLKISLIAGTIKTAIAPFATLIGKASLHNDETVAAGSESKIARALTEAEINAGVEKVKLSEVVDDKAADGTVKAVNTGIVITSAQGTLTSNVSLQAARIAVGLTVGTAAGVAEATGIATAAAALSAEAVGARTGGDITLSPQTAKAFMGAVKSGLFNPTSTTLVNRKSDGLTASANAIVEALPSFLDPQTLASLKARADEMALSGKQGGLAESHRQDMASMGRTAASASNKTLANNNTALAGGVAAQYEDENAINKSVDYRNITSSAITSVNVAISSGTSRKQDDEDAYQAMSRKLAEQREADNRAGAIQGLIDSKSNLIDQYKKGLIDQATYSNTLVTINRAYNSTVTNASEQVDENHSW